ncbi:MAG: alpha/beta hydrolase fold domain-containing protein [Chitinispirillales bacterium]|jgi:acetyl esterase/lipase|nr:alpha/beta hydrolase fold domain-containing protein [Chitinispirillales bacterium]
MKRAIKALLFIAVLTANLFSQMDTAYVPVTVNADAAVLIQSPAGAEAALGDSRVVTPNTVDTLTLILGASTTVSHRAQKVLTVPASVSYGRGNVSLRLNPQVFNNAEVSLLAVNGKRVLRGKASSSNTGGTDISRPNVARGVYLLSVKGADGSSFSTRLVHNGGGFNINVAFGGQNLSVNKRADAYGYWKISVTPTAGGYADTSYTFAPVKGMNTAQNITLRRIQISGCGYQTSFCGGMAAADVTHNSTSIPSTGGCVFISDFGAIQPNLNSTVAINGVENTCGSEWGEEEGKCPFNTKPAPVDGGYYVYVKTGTVNTYQNNGWQGVAAGTKSADCGGTVTPDTGTCTPAARTYNNIEYNTARSRNKLDLTLPGSGSGPWPLIVFIHGGGFSGGDKDATTAPFTASTANSRGYAFASIQYTLMSGSQTGFPSAVEDALAAIRFLRANAAGYCINPGKIGVAGFSAGGYLTAMAAALSGASDHGFDNVSLGNSGVSSKVQAAVSLSGLTDLTQLDAQHAASGINSMFGSHCNYNVTFFGFNPCNATGANQTIVERSNPLTWITQANCASLPPVLMEHCKPDNITPWQSSKIFVDKINEVCGAGRAAGNYHETGGHGSGYSGAAVIYDNFLDKYLK